MSEVNTSPPAAPLFTLDLKENGSLFAPTSLAEVSAWIQREMSFWSWLNGSRAGGNHDQGIKQAINQLNQAQNTVNQAPQYKDSNPQHYQQQLAGIRSQLEEVFLRQRLPHSSTPLAQRIELYRKEAGDHPASFFASVFVPPQQGHHFQPQELVGWRGLIEGLIERYGLASAPAKGRKQLRLVRHLPKRADDRTPPMPAGRCCISPEGGNRGERRSGCWAQQLWRLRGADAAFVLRFKHCRACTDGHARSDSRDGAPPATRRAATKHRFRAAHEEPHRTPRTTPNSWTLMQRGHGVGGARIEQSRWKTCSTIRPWPQCLQTKVGAGASCSLLIVASGAGASGATCSSSRTSARLARRLPLASKP